MASGDRPRLLYASPVIPSLTGNGLAMRAGMVLEALASRFSISLLVLNLYAGDGLDVPDYFKHLCRDVTVMAPPKAGSADRPWSKWFGPLAAYRQTRFDVIHVFRLATLSMVRSLAESRSSGTVFQLDLDDIESATHRRLANLYRINGDDLRGRFEDFEAQRCGKIEDAAFQELDKVFVCSERDRAALVLRGASCVAILPNAIRLPASAAAAPDRPGLRLLFLGTLGYFPNEDAALWLCNEIVPPVRDALNSNGGELQIRIAGAGASERLKLAAQQARAELLGRVDDVAESYAWADASVVPLRAGGGTRIKILESFSYLRPVVSTPMGAEGLYVLDGRDILIANTPRAFAESCVRLAQDREVRKQLVVNARALVERTYSLAAVREALDVHSRPS
jgi:glycosyltransferase involved in cell wall biosynthesis